VFYVTIWKWVLTTGNGEIEFGCALVGLRRFSFNKPGNSYFVIGREMWYILRMTYAGWIFLEALGDVIWSIRCELSVIG